MPKAIYIGGRMHGFIEELKKPNSVRYFSVPEKTPVNAFLEKDPDPVFKVIRLEYRLSQYQEIDGMLTYLFFKEY